MDKLVKSWYLEHHNNAENKHKFYEIQIHRNSAGMFEVVRRYGRIGTNPKGKVVDSFKSFLSAEVKAQELVSGKRFSNRDKYDLVKEQDLDMPNSNRDEPEQTAPAPIKPKHNLHPLMVMKYGAGGVAILGYYDDTQANPWRECAKASLSGVAAGVMDIVMAEMTDAEESGLRLAVAHSMDNGIPDEACVRPF